jgi:hypothetical protein
MIQIIRPIITLPQPIVTSPWFPSSNTSVSLRATVRHRTRSVDSALNLQDKGRPEHYPRCGSSGRFLGKGLIFRKGRLAVSRFGDPTFSLSHS